jgi:tripartite-type tricarboxylate transporter receptor subunit TctC
MTTPVLLVAIGKKWFGTARIPRTDVIDRLYRECARIIAEPEVRQRLIDLGNEPVGNTPEQFAADIKAEAPRWKEIADKAAIRLE